MWSLARLLALLCVLPLHAALLTGQSAEAGNGVDVSRSLLRLERMQPSQDVCVLVNANGQYHLERLLATRTDIFEGVIPADSMELVNQAIGNDEILKLSQEEVRIPLTHELDDLFLSISRPGGWQNLKLLGSEGREPYRESLDPLLKLLAELPKAKHQKISEDAGRNNCMPPGNIELATRPDRQKAALDSARQYLMSLQVTNKSEYNVKNTCVLVYSDGHYHMERWMQRLGSTYGETSVFEGIITKNMLQQLRALLDNPALQNRPESSPRIDFPVWQAEITFLSVRRGDHIQKLAFWQYVGSKAGGSVYTPPHRENGTRLVSPLQQWLKTNLKPRGDAELPSTQANRCETAD